MKSPNTTWTARTKRICQSDRTSSRESSRGSSTRSRHSPRTTTSAGLRLQEPFSHVSQRLVFHCSKCWIFSIIIFFISNLFYNFLPWNNLVKHLFNCLLSAFDESIVDDVYDYWLTKRQKAMQSRTFNLGIGGLIPKIRNDCRKVKLGFLFGWMHS